MRIFAAGLAAVLAVCAVAAPETLAARKPVTFEELKRGFKQPSMAFAPFAFWFWDAPLDPARAADEASKMLEQGFMPGYAHPRTGLPTNEWLSPKWFRTLDAALTKVEKAGGYMGYCDEYDWPSGRANGRVLAKHPELHALSLNWKITDVADGQSVNLPQSFFTVAARVGSDGKIDAKTLRIIGGGKAFSWRAPDGSDRSPEGAPGLSLAGIAGLQAIVTPAHRLPSPLPIPDTRHPIPDTRSWRVYSFTKFLSQAQGSAVNYLDDRLMPAFFDIAYKPYEKYFGKRLGKNMCGIFVDNEGAYGWRVCWSDYLAGVYKQKFGRDIRLWMPMLVEQDADGVYAKARWEWMDAVSDVYASNFFGNISKWAGEHGMYCTMHVWEESLLLQAEAVGDFFKVERAVSMPGTDSLKSKPLEPQEFKETQSITEFEGRRQTCEALGVVGWEMTPVLLKQASNALTAWGVSHIMPHGVYMREDLNTIPYPPDFGAENPYFRYLHNWTDFTRRASYVISHGHTVPDVLLVNPMDSLWATIGDWLFVPHPGAHQRVDHINTVYTDAIRRLTAARIEFLIADRHYLRKMSVTGLRLAMGDFSFGSVVLPPMIVLPLDVAQKIVDFAKAGGNVYVLGELPSGSTDNGMGDPKMAALMRELRGLPSVVECKDGLAAELLSPGTRLTPAITFESGTFPMLQSHRRIAGHDFYWLANQTDEPQRSSLRFPTGGSTPRAIWDCETGEVKPLHCVEAASGAVVSQSFEPYEAFFVECESGAPPQTPSERGPATSDFRLAGPWKVQIPTEGQPSLSPNCAKLFTVFNISQWMKVNGATRFRRTFVLPATPDRATLLYTADEGLSIYVNGKALTRHGWDGVWQQVSKVDVGKLLKKGRNVIAIRASKAHGEGGAILQGDVLLPGGKTVTIASGPEWRTSPDEAEAAPFDKWIWDPIVKEHQIVYFQRSFALPAGPYQASITVTADNRFTLYVNATRVGSHEPWMQPMTYDVSKLLRSGLNEIAVEATNLDGPAGLLAALRVKLPDGKTVGVDTDNTWRVSDVATSGWQTTEQTGWGHAKAVATYGDQPWGRFPETDLGIVPPWAAPDFDDHSWASAEPGTAKEDVPPALLSGEERPLESWLKWGLDRFTGFMDYTTRVDLPACRKAVLNLGDVKHTAEVWVNGKKVGDRLWPPFDFDITSAMKPGENSVTVRVGNLMTNEMGQFADRGLLGTWSWGPAPPREAFDAGLLGPVVVAVWE